METITYEEACLIFEDAQCVSVPYKYHNMDTSEPMQLYLGLLSKENRYGLGGDFINATLHLGSNKMHIISPSEHYVVKDVSEKEYNAFYITRAYGI